MNEEAVEPQEIAEPIEQIMDEAIAEPEVQEDSPDVDSSGKTMIPLSVAQKLREQKKEKELENQWLRQQNAELMARQSQVVQPPVDDNSRFESATIEDLSKSQAEIIRIVEEKKWIKDNPELYERVVQDLPKFLKQRPNLASAINDASNRYEEAYELMDKLSPKQQQQLRAQPATPKKVAPNSPGGVPKAAAMNEAVDVMSMSDSDFAAWRKSKQRR